jgi:hypothetical protein
LNRHGAREILTGTIPGPYRDQDAERFARLALVDADVIARHPRAAQAQLAQLLGIPHDQPADRVPAQRPDRRHTSPAAALSGPPARATLHNYRAMTLKRQADPDTARASGATNARFARRRGAARHLKLAH